MIPITQYENYLSVLHQELIPALGCTEPIAIALASAKARAVLGEFPASIEIMCSGNIIKNVMGVVVPMSNGQKGIAVATALGALGGNPDGELEVLAGITEAHRQQAGQLIRSGFVTCKLKENVDNLYIVATAKTALHSAAVTIINRHTLISRIVKDDVVVFELDGLSESQQSCDKSLLNVRDIVSFADTVQIEDIREVLEQQIELNTAISDTGLHDCYGAQVGRTLLEEFGNDTRTRAKARAAAGSDARMSGCTLPVVINSGSGNQGLTVSLPVIEYSQALNTSHDRLLRALVISNLVAIHQKDYLGNLSAFCGAVSAACGAGAAITYLHGGNYRQISDTIINTIANVGGIFCDGAKASCAAKIASAVDAAIMAHVMSMRGLTFLDGDGIVQHDVESTIQSVGYIGRVGMKSTDIEILHVMTNEVNFT